MEYPTITLYGNMCFKVGFMEVQKRLILKENIVISVDLLGHSCDLDV